MTGQGKARQDSLDQGRAGQGYYRGTGRGKAGQRREGHCGRRGMVRNKADRCIARQAGQRRVFVFFFRDAATKNPAGLCPSGRVRRGM